jgi:hypothetical protein
MNLCDLTETFNNLHGGKCVWRLRLFSFFHQVGERNENSKVKLIKFLSYRFFPTIDRFVGEKRFSNGAFSESKGA